MAKEIADRARAQFSGTVRSSNLKKNQGIKLERKEKLGHDNEMYFGFLNISDFFEDRVAKFEVLRVYSSIRLHLVYVTFCIEYRQTPLITSFIKGTVS